MTNGIVHADDVHAWGPAGYLDPIQLDSLFGLRSQLLAEEILASDLIDADAKLWLVLRRDVLADTTLRRIATAVATAGLDVRPRPLGVFVQGLLAAITACHLPELARLDEHRATLEQAFAELDWTHERTALVSLACLACCEPDAEGAARFVVGILDYLGDDRLRLVADAISVSEWPVAEAR